MTFPAGQFLYDSNCRTISVICLLTVKHSLYFRTIPVNRQLIRLLFKGKKTLLFVHSVTLLSPQRGGWNVVVVDHYTFLSL